MARRLLACAAFTVLAVLVAGGEARADLPDDAARVARLWTERGARVERLAPIFVEHGRLHRLKLPVERDAAESKGCTTLALLAVRTAELLAGPGTASPDAAGPPGSPRQRSSAGAVAISRCGAARAELSRVVVELVSPRAAVELLLARSEAPLPPLHEVLPERDPGPAAPRGDTGGPLEPGPLAERVARAERRARADGAAQVTRSVVRASANGAGQGEMQLGEGCYRVDLMAEVPSFFPHRATDVDAEVRDASGKALARDRAEVPDARLDFCLGEAGRVTIPFTGAAGPLPVTLSTARWPLSPHVPARWGARGRAAFGGAFFRRQVPEPRTPPFHQALGASGITVVPVPIVPGRCYLAALAPIRGDARLLRLVATVGDHVLRDDAFERLEGVAVSFCSASEPVVRLDVDVRGSATWWALAVWPMGSTTP